MGRLRLAIWGLGVTLAMREAAVPPAAAPVASAAPNAPRLTMKSAQEVISQGLPAVSADGAHVAYTSAETGYDDVTVETFFLSSVAGGPIEKSILFCKLVEGAKSQLSLKQVREAVQSANDLLKNFHQLAAYQVRKLPSQGDADAGEKAYPYYRQQQGTRQLIYSPRSGRLELSDGKNALLKESVKFKRPWPCCDQAGPSEGGCKRPPETVEGAWGDGSVIVVAFGWKSGHDGCEVQKEHGVFHFAAPPPAASAPPPGK